METTTEKSDWQVGDRVGAIMSADKIEVCFLGYGHYAGDEVPPPEVLFMGQPMEFPNPKIVLDSGKVVWGCECWWGPEEKIKASLAGRRVKEMDIEEERAAVARQRAQIEAAFEGKQSAQPLPAKYRAALDELYAKWGVGETAKQRRAFWDSYEPHTHATHLKTDEEWVGAFELRWLIGRFPEEEGFC